jgi:hypothetical protein
LQVLGALALLSFFHLAWQATPWGGEGWSRARMLYAGAGGVSSLALIAIGGLGIALRRQQEALARIEAALRQRQG